jgi:hypothetical protein
MKNQKYKLLDRYHLFLTYLALRMDIASMASE